MREREVRERLVQEARVQRPEARKGWSHRTRASHPPFGGPSQTLELLEEVREWDRALLSSSVGLP